MAARVIKRWEPVCVCVCVLCVFAKSVISVCRFILHAKKTAFVVEHDFIMATYLADRVVVFEGTPSVNTGANA